MDTAKTIADAKTIQDFEKIIADAKAGIERLSQREPDVGDRFTKGNQTVIIVKLPYSTYSWIKPTNYNMSYNLVWSSLKEAGEYWYGLGYTLESK